MRLLILDYDGTLAPFRVDRMGALPYPGVTDSLELIMRSARSRVVIISGRTIAELLELLDMSRFPELWGSHGWERMTPDGNITAFPPDPEARRGLDEAERFLSDIGLSARSERKPASLALHVRGLADGRATAIRESVTDTWRSIADRNGLYVSDFDGGLELRTPGRDKGSALEEVLRDAPQNAVIAYMGDDNTDEDAFRALGQRGLGVLVNAVLRPTMADIWISPPDELNHFLERWAGACGGSE